RCEAASHLIRSCDLPSVAAPVSPRGYLTEGDNLPLEVAIATGVLRGSARSAAAPPACVAQRLRSPAPTWARADAPGAHRSPEAGRPADRHPPQRCSAIGERVGRRTSGAPPRPPTSSAGSALDLPLRRATLPSPRSKRGTSRGVLAQLVERYNGIVEVRS